MKTMRKKIITIIICMLVCTAILPLAANAMNSNVVKTNTQHTSTLQNNDTIIASYQFDEGSGNFTYDSSGNNLTGIVVNGIWSAGAGESGSSLSFNKEENRYVIVEDSPLFDLETFTISASFRPETNISTWPRGYQTIVSKEYQYILRFAANYCDGREAVSAIYFTGPGTFDYRCVTVFFDQLDPSLMPKEGVWSTIKMTYNGTVLDLFINDVLLGETYCPASEYAPTYSDVPLIIGNHQMGGMTPPGSSIDEFIGDIDNVQISGGPNGNYTHSNNGKTFVAGIIRQPAHGGHLQGIVYYNVLAKKKTGLISAENFPYYYKLNQLEKVIHLGSSTRLIFGYIEGSYL
jgi:hypothetical protein